MRHLAALQRLVNNAKIPAFFMNAKPQQFNIKAVADSYGPSKLAFMPSSEDPNAPHFGKMFGIPEHLGKVIGFLTKALK